MKIPGLISLTVLLMVTMPACSSVSDFIATPTFVPAPTSLPTLTSVPSLAATSPLLEATTFSRAGCFNLDSTPDVKRYEKNGQLHMEVLTPRILAWSLCENNTFSDFVMELDATQVEGVDDNGYGMVIRYNDSKDQYYVFAISGDGYYIFALDGLSMGTPEIP